MALAITPAARFPGPLCNEPVEGGDWSGCARALLDHGMPRAKPDQDDPDWVLIDGRRKRFSDEVTEILLDAP